MKNNLFKQFLPHLVATLIFIIIAALYFSPVFKGKEIRQGDIINFEGMAKEIKDYRESSGEEALWTNSMFGGMPAYQISVLYPSNLVAKVNKVFQLGLPHPVGYVFLYMFCFYFLLLVLKIDPWLSIIGAIAFGFSSYFFIIIEAGHNSKAHAIGYIPALFAGVILVFRKRYLLGGAITALFLALELYANHLQITYYLMLLLIVYGFCETIKIFKQKDYQHLVKLTGIFIIALAVGVGSNITSLWATYDYGKYTTRGKTDLTINADGSSNQENVTSGLDKDYATQWSYGISETMTFLIPNYKGGGSGALLYKDLVAANQGKGKEKREAEEKLKNYDDAFLQGIISRLQSGNYINEYWGDQPFTSGPVYVGSILLFFFFIGLFLLKGSLKWVLVTGTLLSIVLGWGRNFMPVTEFFLEYFPGYNKFRTVSMILILAELTIPALGILGVHFLITKREKLKDLIKLPLISSPIERYKLIYVAYSLTGGVSLLLYFFPSLFAELFKMGEYDNLFTELTQKGSLEEATLFLENLKSARANILKSDALRSFIFITLALGLVFIFLKSFIKEKVLYLSLAVLILGDFWTVNKRYLNDENFVKKAEAKVPYSPTSANLQILQDNDPHFRVFNVSVSSFNDASTSYFHKSIGGYHGAKLKRYQELIDFHISKNNMKVLDMLNTKYFIVPDNNRQATAQRNYQALGNAWLVDSLIFVENADEEILSLNKINPKNTAVTESKFDQILEAPLINRDSNAVISLREYKPNHLMYDFSSNTSQLAVFSEIYYDKGWNAYINDVLVEHARVNYVLRGLTIPAGNHKIEFKFEPRIYKLGERWSLISSSLLIIMVLGVFILEVKKLLRN